MVARDTHAPQRERSHEAEPRVEVDRLVRGRSRAKQEGYKHLTTGHHTCQVFEQEWSTGLSEKLSPNGNLTTRCPADFILHVDHGRTDRVHESLSRPTRRRLIPGGHD